MITFQTFFCLYQSMCFGGGSRKSDDRMKTRVTWAQKLFATKLIRDGVGPEPF